MPCHGKGSQFEREICKQLSEWWTGGERDDIFWRSSQSGGRATMRWRKGKGTSGSYGDITAVDPSGQPLVEAFTLELKRGRSHGSPVDLLEMPPSRIKVGGPLRKFESTLWQARYSAQCAGNEWILISRPDKRRTILYFSQRTLELFGFLAQTLRKKDFVTYSVRLMAVSYKDGLQISRPDLPMKRIRFVGLPLDIFLANISPDDIRAVVSIIKKNKQIK